MKLLTYKEDGQLKLGIKTDLGVLNVEKAGNTYNQEVPKTIEEVINNSENGLSVLDSLAKTALEVENSSLFLEEESLTMGPAVPNPGKIICVGVNYKEHAEESNMALPEYPLLFSKFNNTLSGHNQVVYLPNDSNENDYEAELVLVIGKEAKNVSKENALDYVFGYSNGNDLSSRDLQFRTVQWLLGKSPDGFCPVGPYVVTSDEVGDPHNLQIKSIVNGEVRQNSNTSFMIFKCDELVSYISNYMTLNPGDIILTGTPEGVALGYPQDERANYYLKDGDVVTVEIDKLGKLTNTLKQETK
ncbi:2-keto-4-pentenoate hydratase/2-oxohepta-3-ene-1,7-dioic acid hydratase [Schinkia azotoformans MEV2011]|uniref:2-keto-4-pentenoate hydratase/2-oxohepta-3-ene-1,7-dioic acid hydratase n=1 Tax=Schinkia azotoformans MEV2011 TaxID=1348973 RepID=A0A072P1W9_SCHAZ|nr:fumarylacetoacetate hydrolase family protein [Schinkia azotoformans]KEF39490.1 2-keto-4-pentenoate hydratase/2-oxohepta-3-ene-1,7-dioic acid hydratase [Schinkia azotoformans MEV2011]MEC1694182.1 fumarylacetoacetate hydrolase family protein [Schinkia azotoformans]MEC1723604.1 fumarylacetoacetate hydrolase family protein [Schinkia azotoformans]MEC1781482.1 fumarylacetoacetate hydrolase family protein [Schinkia azotoformans]MED4329434.1 fumarylacetoacetate hydrolase family protein [Schinkia az